MRNKIVYTLGKSITVIAASVGLGKTIFLIDELRTHCVNGDNVLLISFENSVENMYKRFFTGYDRSIFKGDIAFNEFIHEDDSSSDSIIDYIEKLLIVTESKVIAIDALYMLPYNISTMSEAEHFSYMIDKLNVIADKCNVSFILTQQLQRSGVFSSKRLIT